MKKLFLILSLISSFCASAQPTRGGGGRAVKCSYDIPMPASTYIALVEERSLRMNCNMQFLDAVTFTSTTTKKPYNIPKNTRTGTSIYEISENNCGTTLMSGLLKMPLEMTGHDGLGKPIFKEHNARFTLILNKNKDSADVYLMGEGNNIMRVKRAQRLFQVAGKVANNAWSIDFETEKGRIRLNFFKEELVGK